MESPRAIPIVKLVTNKNHSYELDEAALASILKKPKVENKKVAIISVVGAFRKGKSFLLNFIVLYLKSITNQLRTSSKKTEWFTENTELACFPWRGGSDRDTCGILMWSEPFIVNDKDGNEIVVLLMDTQGTFDSNSTMQECATIFSLSTMISSFQIYNISQAIQEDYLQHLRLFIEYGSLAMEDNDNVPFQTLLFLIRDWQNSNQFAYGYEGGEKYLEKILKKSHTQKKELQDLRLQIKSYFESLACFLLPHPGLEVSNNRNVKIVGKLEAEFKKFIRLLIPSFFESENLVTKTINGQDIKCGQLIHYFKAYMDIFNSNKLPKPTSILQATAIANNAMAATEAKTLYEMEMKKVMDTNIMDLNLLRQKHISATEKALKKFHETQKMGGEEMSKDFEKTLSKDIQTRFNELATIVNDKIKIEKEKEEQRNQKKLMDEKQKKANEELEKQKFEHEKTVQKEKTELEKRNWRLEQEKSLIEKEKRELEKRTEMQKKEAEALAQQQAQAQRATEAILEMQRTIVTEQAERLERTEERINQAIRDDAEARERERREEMERRRQQEKKPDCFLS